MKGGNRETNGSEVTLPLEPRSGSLFLAVGETHGRTIETFLSNRVNLFSIPSRALQRGRE